MGEGALRTGLFDGSLGVIKLKDLGIEAPHWQLLEVLSLASLLFQGGLFGLLVQAEELLEAYSGGNDEGTQEADYAPPALAFIDHAAGVVDDHSDDNQVLDGDFAARDIEVGGSVLLTFDVEAGKESELEVPILWVAFGDDEKTFESQAPQKEWRDIH